MAQPGVVRQIDSVSARRRHWWYVKAGLCRYVSRRSMQNELDMECR
jgi:hypothetical protein